MFLAHFSHTPLNVIEEWPAATVLFYYNEAIKLHNKFNKTE